MTHLNAGDTAPDFTLPADNDGTVTLSDFRGEKLVLYFYPKDNTPGCTTQSCDFRDQQPEFAKLNAKIIGVSKDSVKKHNNFKAKYDFNFPLASDENGTVCEDYGTWVEKSMYGKTFMGIQRTTFLIDENGVIERVWNKVKVKGHVDEVNATLKESAAKAA